MLTLVKFIWNYRQDSSNKLISRTLGKLGVLARDCEQKPKHNEWWYCTIQKEVGHGTDKGVFVLNPVEYLAETDGRQELLYLYPGSFNIVRKGSALLMFPDKQGYPWICPTSMKRHLINKYKKEDHYDLNAIIVVHDNATDWPIEV